MAFNLDVPKSFEVEARRDDFVIDVIGRQAGVGMVGKQRRERARGSSGYPIAGIVGADGKPLYDPVPPRDIPSTNIAFGLEDAAVDDVIVDKAAILRIELQFPPGVFAIELVGPVCPRSVGIRDEAPARIVGAYE